MGFLDFIFRKSSSARSGSLSGSQDALSSLQEGLLLDFPPELLRQRLPLGPGCEKLACWYLESQGMKLLTKNARSHAGRLVGPVAGELDLIMETPDPKKTLVFVEVRSREDDWREFGLPAQSIGTRKKLRIRRAAQNWLRENKISLNRPIRFDVVSIVWKENQPPRLWYAPNAFSWD